MTVLLWIIYALFGIAAVLTVVRIILGPSILDRVVASDVLLTEVMCVLGADMVINHYTETLPVLLIIAAVGVFGSIAIARFVARKDVEMPDGSGAGASGSGAAGAPGSAQEGEAS
jgi:multicomponent Na+:H+ antiporter subunit F